MFSGDGMNCRQTHFRQNLPQTNLIFDGTEFAGVFLEIEEEGHVTPHVMVPIHVGGPGDTVTGEVVLG